MRVLFAFLISVCLLAAGYVWLTHSNSGPAVRFQTIQVKKGDLNITISATGTIEPEEVVDVGAQVVGRIDSLGVDPKDSSKTIDYRSEVRAGTVLAKIDDSIFVAQVAQAKANLDHAMADVAQYEAKLVQAERDLKRAKSLISTHAIADADVDLAVANEGVARAALAVGKTAVAQAEAQLKLSETNLGYTTIHSPVDGVIVDRRVNVGQTVVASLNAPSMFLIAKDLSRLQVWASVNEADIGRISVGQRATFRVDAYPQKTFEAQVTQIRLNATMTQNVVTYTVVMVTDNGEGLLLPYLTANVLFRAESMADVLQLPNSALRWRPRKDLILPSIREQFDAARRGAGRKDSGDARSMVWVAEGEFVKPIGVTVGLSDGMTTAVSGDELQDGMAVVTGIAQKDAEEVNSPFMPKVFRGNSGNRPQ
jgi:HlyD family secretion protein